MDINKEALRQDYDETVGDAEEAYDTAKGKMNDLGRELEDGWDRLADRVGDAACTTEDEISDRF